MDLTIRPLDPDCADDFLRFFDHEAFSDNPDWADCYCTFYHRTMPLSEWQTRTAARKRADALSLIESGRMRGYLARDGAEVVGWCNANRKTAYPVLTEDLGLRSPDDPAIVSVVCFVIRPDRRRAGISARLLEAVVADARKTEGIRFVEAYPVKEAQTAASNYHGYPIMYSRAGFEISAETERLLIVRKAV